MRLLMLLAALSLAAFCRLTDLDRTTPQPEPNAAPIAAANGDLAAVRRYLAAGGDPNAAVPGLGFRLLGTAARASRLDVIAALHAAGADPNLRDPGGNRWVPLMHAVHKHQTAAVRALLDRQAKPDGPADLRLTPLMMAAASGQTDVARMLLDAGADPHRRTPDDASLVTLAVSGGALTDIDAPLLGGCHPDTVRLLKERAPDVVLDHSLRGRLAVLFARLNGCRQVLLLIGD
jgi:hypothetical protein